MNNLVEMTLVVLLPVLRDEFRTVLQGQASPCASASPSWFGTGLEVVPQPQPRLMGGPAKAWGRLSGLLDLESGMKALNYQELSLPWNLPLGREGRGRLINSVPW